MNENLESEPVLIKVIAFGALVLLGILVWQSERILEAVRETPKETVKFIHTEFNP